MLHVHRTFGTVNLLKESGEDISFPSTVEEWFLQIAEGAATVVLIDAVEP